MLFVRFETACNPGYLDATVFNYNEFAKNLSLSLI